MVCLDIDVLGLVIIFFQENKKVHNSCWWRGGIGLYSEFV